MSLAQKYARNLAAIYAAVGSFWVFLSDRVAHSITTNQEALTKFQTFKGLLFIILTTSLIYFLGKRGGKGIEAKTLSKRLHDNKLRNEKIFGQLGEVVLYLNPDNHEVVKCSSAITDVFGYSVEEVLGQKCSFFHLDSSNHEEFGRRYTEDIDRCGISRSQFPLKRKDGSTLEAELTLFNVEEVEPELGSFVVIIRDLTERSHLQAQLQQAQRMGSIGTMASGIAHEMNNPIMIISQYAELIQERMKDDDEISKGSAIIIKQVERVHAISNNLLGYARTDDNPKSVTLSLGEVIERSIELTQANLRHDSIQLELNYPDHCPSVQGYPHQFQQVIINLINNSKYALNERFPESNEDKRLIISLDTNGDSSKTFVVLTIEDHGIGMKQENIDRIFEPFYTTKPRGKGTGLGLWIIYEIVKKHQGRISVESEPNSFTKFVLSFPCSETSSAPQEENMVLRN